MRLVIQPHEHHTSHKYIGNNGRFLFLMNVSYREEKRSTILVSTSPVDKVTRCHVQLLVVLN